MGGVLRILGTLDFGVRWHTGNPKRDHCFDNLPCEQLPQGRLLKLVEVGEIV